MSAMMIALNTTNPDEPEALKEYSQSAIALIRAAGGKPVGRYDFNEIVTGDNFPNVVLAVEFPSAGAIRTLFDSKEYKALIPLRDKGFKSFNVCICNAD
ncbi:MAG TPA: DUF1330 domain-containing protein [Rhizobiales bacterium]|nr:DUF1330 domain-containing protein [Hyphomicrobiales bacterium]